MKGSAQYRYPIVIKTQHDVPVGMVDAEAVLVEPFKTRAMIKPIDKTEMEDGFNAEDGPTHVFKIRYCKGITTDHVIHYGDLVFYIRSMQEDPLKVYINLYVEQLND